MMIPQGFLTRGAVAVCLLPKVPSGNFARPEQPIEMAFHDSSAVRVNFEDTAQKPLADDVEYPQLSC